MPEYGFKVVFPDPESLINAGFGKVAHVPVIFDSQPGYARLPNRFLIDRALGHWDPRWRGERLNPHRPSRVSMRNFAYWLCNALEWAEVRGVELMTADYSTILISRYQGEMLKGIWSSSGESLAAETVNARVQTALEFQMWAADKGLRDPLKIPAFTRSHLVGSHENSNGDNLKIVEARTGKVKVNKRLLVFPADCEVEMWRDRIYKKPIVGATNGLMVDHILNTAIRREELACWRLDTLPLNPSDWIIINPRQPEAVQQVVVEIRYGTKGKEFYIDEFGDKVGPQGTIQVPLWLAKRIHVYRSSERLHALKNITKGVRNLSKTRSLLEQSVHLYLNPKTGKRFTGAQIYEIWTAVEGPKHWSPHLGRDWWACQYLWQKMQEHLKLIEQIQLITNLKPDHPLLYILRDTAQTVIQLEIRPQLRHASSHTTEIYLHWLFNQLRMPISLTSRWQEEDAITEDVV